MERRKQELEMQVLMSQINPHFLYNTLETIVWKASEAGRPDISKMASSLGKLYRLSISGGLFVPLRQELEHVQMHMNIQRIRYGSKIDYDVRLHGCDAASVEVLKLILQPVVSCLLKKAPDSINADRQIQRFNDLQTSDIRLFFQKRKNSLMICIGQFWLLSTEIRLSFVAACFVPTLQQTID